MSTYPTTLILTLDFFDVVPTGLTQWAEDKPTATKKVVAKAVVAHLLYVAEAISPQTVQSWAATR